VSEQDQKPPDQKPPDQKPPDQKPPDQKPQANKGGRPPGSKNRVPKNLHILKKSSADKGAAAAFKDREKPPVEKPPAVQKEIRQEETLSLSSALNEDDFTDVLSFVINLVFDRLSWRKLSTFEADTLGKRAFKVVEKRIDPVISEYFDIIGLGAVTITLILGRVREAGNIHNPRETKKGKDDSGKIHEQGTPPGNDIRSEA
jgi:hypothetical protein